MFCSNCGTQLSDGARFCSSCGKPVDSSQTAVDSSQPTNTTTPEQLDIAIQGTAIMLGEKDLITLARYGPVTNEDVHEACEKVKRLRETSPSLRDFGTLGYYELARNIEKHLAQRWLPRNIPQKQIRQLLTKDWEDYLYSPGVKGLFSIYPDITDEQISHLQFKLKGLSIWLEDLLLRQLLTALMLSGERFDGKHFEGLRIVGDRDSDLLQLITKVGGDRAEGVVNFATFLISKTKK